MGFNMMYVFREALGFDDFVTHYNPNDRKYTAEKDGRVLVTIHKEDLANLRSDDELVEIVKDRLEKELNYVVTSVKEQDE